jgi:hypothetical protein
MDQILIAYLYKHYHHQMDQGTLHRVVKYSTPKLTMILIPTLSLQMDQDIHTHSLVKQTLSVSRKMDQDMDSLAIPTLWTTAQYSDVLI